MKKLITLLSAAIVALFLSGCLTDAKLIRKAKERGLIKDSASVTVDTGKPKLGPLRIDTMWISVEVPGPIQWIPHPCAHLCDSSGHLKPIHQTAHGHGMTTNIDSQGDSLRFSAQADSLMEITARQNIYIDILQRAYNERLVNEIRKQKHEATWYDKVGYACAFILMGSLLIVIALWLLRRK